METTQETPALPRRAQMSVVEILPPDMPRSSRGISVRYGVLRLDMPDGTRHEFPIISGGFGEGAIPGLDAKLASAQGKRFPVAEATSGDLAAQTGLPPVSPEQSREILEALKNSGWVFPLTEQATPPSEEKPVLPSNVRAVYEIYSAAQKVGKEGFRTGGADFMIRFISPDDVKRGLTRAQMDRGELGAFGLHPDGRNGDTIQPPIGPMLRMRDSSPDNGNNGCLSLSSKDAKRFEDLYFGLPSDQRPTHVYFLEPEGERLPPLRSFKESFSGLAR